MKIYNLKGGPVFGGLTVGGAIFNSDTINIYFTIIASNEAGDERGGIFEAGASINIRNSIVAFNTATTSGPNCNGDIATLVDEINNYSNDASFGFGLGFDNTTILLGPLAENGGPTQTLALLGGDPLDGAFPDCDAINNLTVPVPDDHRGFARPSGMLCDAGAYESSNVDVKITKITIPSGLTGFPFSGSMSFDNAAPGCEITDNFILDDLDMASCIVPIGDYTITEDIPDDQVVAIICEELPEGSMIDSLNGTLSFTIDEEGDNVDCLFINSLANIVLRATVEPPGPNCEFGGQMIESGPDINQNSVLDDDEIDPNLTFFV